MRSENRGLSRRQRRVADRPNRFPQAPDNLISLRDDDTLGITDLGSFREHCICSGALVSQIPVPGNGSPRRFRRSLDRFSRSLLAFLQVTRKAG